MKRRNERTQGFFGMGASLLLTVFLVLMLVTFSLLSLSMARGDLERSERLAQQRTEFYQMSNQAERVIQQLHLGQTPEHPVTMDGETAEFEIFGTNNRVLRVNLRLHDGKWQIIQWKTTTN